MDWRGLAQRWKHPEPEATTPPASTCTCHPPDVPLGLAAFDCPAHGWEAQREDGEPPAWPPPLLVIRTGAERAEKVVGFLRGIAMGTWGLASAYGLGAVVALVYGRLGLAAGLAVIAFACERVAHYAERRVADAVFVRDVLRGASRE